MCSIYVAPFYNVVTMFFYHWFVFHWQFLDNICQDLDFMYGYKLWYKPF